MELRRQGLKTPVESAEPTRSDCHAWGSHPLFHFFATLLGIRPAGWGFREVEIAPLLGSLEHASGRLVHPSGGEIVVDLEQKDGALHGRVVLPPTVTGTLRLGTGRRPLRRRRDALLTGLRGPRKGRLSPSGSDSLVSWCDSAG